MKTNEKNAYAKNSAKKVSGDKHLSKGVKLFSCDIRSDFGGKSYLDPTTKVFSSKKDFKNREHLQHCKNLSKNKSKT